MKIIDCDQNSQEWQNLRSSMPTASEASKLITSTGEPSKQLNQYAEKLACNMYAGKDLSEWEGNIYTERGHEIEINARAAYELQNNVDVVQAGFITDDKERFGCSPDGLIMGEEIPEIEGMLEIKCLPKNHIKALIYFDKYDTYPPEYAAQCQFQLLVTGLKWNDLMFYHDELPNLTIRIYPDEAIHDALLTQIDRVINRRDGVLAILESLKYS